MSEVDGDYWVTVCNDHYFKASCWQFVRFDEMSLEINKPVLSSTQAQQLANKLRQELKVEVDWKGYFESFSSVHGGEPETYGNRLLFRDGWQYSISYSGPEWAPPKDEKELLLLKIAYWSLRTSRLRVVKLVLNEKLEAWERTASMYSLPLPVRKQYVDRETDQVKSSSEFLDIRVLKARLKNTDKELDLCLETLENYELRYESLSSPRESGHAVSLQNKGSVG